MTSSNGNSTSTGAEHAAAVRRFLTLLAHQLSSSAHAPFPSSHHLEQLLRQSVLDLPAGKLRSTLLHHHHFSTFVSALRHEIEATSHSLQDPFSTEDGATLVENVTKEVETLCSVPDNGQATELSLEARRRLLSSRDPPLNVVWAMAALEIAHPRHFRAIEKELPATPFSTTGLLLGCLKPLIVGHTSASTAVAALAPLVPVMLQALQECSNPLQFDSLQSLSNDTTTISKLARKDTKALQSRLRQVLSFIVVCRNKEKYSNDVPRGRIPLPAQSLRLSPLLHGFSLLVRALKLETLMGQSVPETLALMFPLISKRTIKSLQRPVSKVAKIAEIVTVEFVLLQLILESIVWRNKVNMQGGTIEAIRQQFVATMRALAVHGVVAADHGNDLILDLLLSGLCVSNVLDDKENNLIKIALYEALLVEVPHFGDMSMVTALARKGKICGTFLKKIAVARGGIYSHRLQDEQGYSNDLLQGLSVPLELVQLLKKLKTACKPPENAILNPRILIGWLLNLEDMDFKEIFDRVSMGASKAKRDQEERILIGDNLSSVGEGAPNQSSSKDKEIEPEALFFVDTTGEAKVKGSSAVDMTSNTAISVTKGKKTRKRKKNGVLFHRRIHRTNKKESENLITESMVDVNATDTADED